MRSLPGSAVLLQALQKLRRFANAAGVGSGAVTRASGTKVGDLTDDASQGPEAIRIQIEQSGRLLVLLLLSATDLAVLVGICPWLLLAEALVGAALSDWDEPGLASP